MVESIVAFALRIRALSRSLTSFLSRNERRAKLASNSNRSECPLGGVGGRPDNFPFHFVFFPTASFLSLEGFSVIAVVTWIMAVERRVVNLLPYPSLP
jgi:hypothetical protein